MRVIKGNLIEAALAGGFNCIIHGANCQNIMGAGIAKQIAETFPGAYKADLKTKAGDLSKLGNYTVSKEKDSNGNPFLVYNAYTQYTPGADFKLFALEMFLYKFNIEQIEPWRVLNSVRIGVPWIGCGIGGGDRKEVRKVLEKFSDTTNCKLTVMEL